MLLHEEAFPIRVHISLSMAPMWRQTPSQRTKRLPCARLLKENTRRPHRFFYQREHPSAIAHRKEDSRRFTSLRDLGLLRARECWWRRARRLWMPSLQLTAGHLYSLRQRKGISKSSAIWSRRAH